jgi:hypothetical protein
MVRVSKHKEEYKSEIKAANIKIPLNKYNFSQEFAEMIHKFSEEHHKDHFKIFNAALEEWSKNNIAEINQEIEHIMKSGFNGTREEIEHKIKISARFYYRKKTKRTKKLEQIKEQDPIKKPYIGLSHEFIKLMDEYIKNEIIKKTENIRRKTIFCTFTTTYVEDIKQELNILKEKYDTAEEVYKPEQIADKIKKAFENRFNALAHFNT